MKISYENGKVHYFWVFLKSDILQSLGVSQSEAWDPLQNGGKVGQEDGLISAKGFTGKQKLLDSKKNFWLTHRSQA